MHVKNIRKIVEHIENKQKAEIIKSNGAFQKELDKIININTRNGMFNSQSFSRVIEMRIVDHLNELVEAMIDNITFEESRLNFSFSTEAIEEIWGVTEIYLRNYISNNIKQGLIYSLEHLSYNPDIYVNTLISNYDFKLKSKFEDMIFYNENTEREVTEKEIKRSNLLSYIAIILASVSIYLHFV